MTDRCSFRCFYCRNDNQHLRRHELLSFEEIVFFIKHFADLGINQVRITGGEPLERKGLSELISMLAQIRGIQRISLTTNGYRLAQYARELKQAGLHDVNISLDTLVREKFQSITKVDGLENVLEGIREAKAENLSPKINSVVVRGINDDEILDLLWFSRKENAPVRFIEWMPVSGTSWKKEDVVTEQEILEKVRTIGEVIPYPATSEPATTYFLPSWNIDFGIIPSVSRPFCRLCNRIRLTARGELFTCLFSEQGYPLKRHIHDPNLNLILRQLIFFKEPGFVALRRGSIPISMVEMGG